MSDVVLHIEIVCEACGELLYSSHRPHLPADEVDRSFTMASESTRDLVRLHKRKHQGQAIWNVQARWETPQASVTDDPDMERIACAIVTCDWVGPLEAAEHHSGTGTFHCPKCGTQLLA